MLSCLFVYGTLKSGFQNRYARTLRRDAVLLGPALIRGRMYKLRRYPALRSGEEWISGEVYRLRAPETILKLLDGYEASQYLRVARKAWIGAERSVPCWVYLWRGGLPEFRRVKEWP